MALKHRPQVEIYTSAGSVMCDLTKDFFREAGIDFDEINIMPGGEGEKEHLEVSGDNKTPTVDFDGRIIVGYQADVYDLLVKEHEAKDAVVDADNEKY